MPFLPLPQVETNDYWTAGAHNTYVRENLNYLRKLTYGNGMHVISSQTLTVATATVTISSIPATYENLFLVVFGRNTSAALVADLRIRFNNVATLTYGYSFLRVWDSTESHTGSADTTEISPGRQPAATSTPNILSGMTKMWIPGYAGTTFQKCGTAETAHIEDLSTGNVYIQHNGWFWENTAAISRIDVYSVASFIPGTMISLYGVK